MAMGAKLGSMVAASYLALATLGAGSALALATLGAGSALAQAQPTAPPPIGPATDAAPTPAAPPPIEEHSVQGIAPPEGAPKPTLERFKEVLTPHGRWVETPEYGAAWSPTGLRPTWRPYTNGRWVYTEHGYAFVGFESWSWAAFHYGRWVYYPPYGWIWVPGYEWAPAWVAWRYGAGYVGWAPLGPSVVVATYYKTPSLWTCVRGPNFNRPLSPRVFVRTLFVERVLRRARFAGLPKVGTYQSPPLSYVASVSRSAISQVAASRVAPHWVSGKFAPGKRLREAFKKGKVVAKPPKRALKKRSKATRGRRVMRRGGRRR